MVVVEHQREDKNFAVYLTADDDIEGDYDRLYSYGINDAGRKTTVSQARGAALDYAQGLAKRLDTSVKTNW